jgi:predicted peptidase
MKRVILVFLLSTLQSAVRAADPLQTTQTTVSVTTTYRCWQYLPEGYEGSTEKFPLILFLHGGGESGDDLDLVKKHGLPKEITAGRRLPCIVLAPQNPDKERLWDNRALMALLRKKQEELRVDDSRVYLAGMSRGAHGVYQLMIQNPDHFAAALMVCGGGPVAYAKRLAGTPVWFFHGEQDDAVPAEESRRLHAALLAAEGRTNLTLYPDLGHDCWTRTFADDSVYEWLLSQRRKRDP